MNLNVVITMIGFMNLNVVITMIDMYFKFKKNWCTFHNWEVVYQSFIRILV